MNREESTVEEYESIRNFVERIEVLTFKKSN